jgi:predicted alpha/beta hydrolase family esterase
MFKFLDKWKNQLSSLLIKLSGKGLRKQVIIIGGGEIFKSYYEYISWLRDFELRVHSPSWKQWLTEKLTRKNIEVVRVSMPNTFNAKYEEWEIIFNKYLPFILADSTLVGHSLGAMFFLKYINKNPEILKNISSAHLISPSFENAYTYSVTQKELPNNQKFYFYHSEDDNVVLYKNSTTKKIINLHLNENNVFLFQDRGHFIDSTFPELLQNILNK